MVELFEAVCHLDPHRAVVLVVLLTIAFGFEVVNGFHDTATAVTTVIYTRTLRPIPAVFFSGFCNFLGVLLGGTAIAFSIVHLLPVDLLINATSQSAIIMVLALLSAGMAWNLSTWWLGLPVSSSHTLIGAILGIGMAIGYKRIVVTVAEKIGKTHLTYAQGACAELVAMATIGLADVAGLPVSTTHVLSSGVAGTMWANRSGIQMTTIRKIGLAWILTLPGAMLLAAALYLFGHLAVGH